MSTEYCDIRVYARVSDPDRIVTVLDELFGAEGMRRVEHPRHEPSRFEPERSNTWSVAIASGATGWHGLSGSPIPLFTGCAPGASESRFEAFARSIAAPSFLIQIYDGGTQAQLILESVAGQTRASGYINEDLAAEFHGRLPIAESAFDLWKFALLPELQQFFDESGDWSRCQIRADQADVRAYLHLGHCLLGREAADELAGAALSDAMTELSPYAHPSVRIVYYEWPAGDRLDSQGMPRDWAAWALALGLIYADGSPVLKHDEVLIDGATAGRVRTFVGLSPFRPGGVSIAVEVDGESGYRMVQPQKLRLLRRAASKRQLADGA